MKRHLLILLLIISLIVDTNSKVPEHLIFIGIDGFSSTSLMHADMPTVGYMRNNGASTLSKRCVMPSKSAPNWASMFMGIPTEIHGYTQWDSQAPEIDSPFERKNGILPTFFQIIKESHPHYKIGFVHEWSVLKHLVDTLSMDYHKEAIGYLEYKNLSTDIACDYIRTERPNVLGVIYDCVDSMGHKYGFESEEYYNELSFVDTCIKRIVLSVQEAGFLDDTVFIITSDHGGIDKQHGGISVEEMESPFIICGMGVKEGFEIEEFMIQYDVASIVLDILEIEQPDFWRGRSVDIKNDSDSSPVVVLSRESQANFDNFTVSYDLHGMPVGDNSRNNVIITRSIGGSGKNRTTKSLKNYNN